MPVTLKQAELKLIKDRIEEVKRVIRDEPWYDTVERMKRIYAGYHWSPAELESQPNKDVVTVNFAQANVDIRVTAIAASVPEFVVLPKEPRAQETFHYQRQALTDVWHEINATQAVRQALKDSDIAGLGVVFIGWKFETTRSLPYEGEKELTLDEAEEIVIYDNPIVRRVSPKNFVVDPSHPNIECIDDAQYVVEIKYVSVHELKKDQRLKNTNKLKGATTETATEPEDIIAVQKRSRTEPFVRIFDYWQKENRIHAIIAEELPDQPLLVESFPYPFPGYPYEIIVERWIPDSRYPQGVVQPAEVLIKLLDKYRTLQIRHDARFAKGVVVVNDAVMTEEESDKLQTAEDGAILHTNAEPSNSITPLVFPQLPQTFYMTQQNLVDDINLIMGVNEYRQGLPDKTRRTLGEVQSIIALSASRAQYKQLIFEEFCARVATKILKLLQDEKFCDRTRYMRMTGMSPEEMQLVEWNYRNLVGESDVQVICNSTRPKTQDSEVQKWGFLLQSLTPYVQLGLVNVAPILAEILKLTGISPPKVQEILQTQQNPVIMQLMQAVSQLAQGLQQLELQVQNLAQSSDVEERRLALDEEKTRHKMALDELETSSRVNAQQAKLDAELESKAADILQKLIGT